METSRHYSGNHFLDSLSQENFNLLRGYLTETELRGNGVLCQVGAEIDCVWFPTTAILSVVMVMTQGQDVEACTVGH